MGHALAMIPTRSTSAPFAVLASLVLAGCLVPHDPPSAIPAEGQIPPRTVAPGVRLSLSFETGSGPEGVLHFQAWSENLSNGTLYTRGQCYSPWSWKLTRDNEPVERGPPETNCQPISWADFPARSNQTWSSGWNGTTWKRNPDGVDSLDGTWQPGESGDYLATVQYAFYRTKNSGSYCCPEMASNEIAFTLR